MDSNEKGKINPIIDQVHFQIMVWCGPEDIAEGKDCIIKVKHAYKTQWTAIGQVAIELN